MNCHCGNQNSFSDCCEPYILGKANPPSPEALMRSRYSAHVVGDVKYLKESLAPEARKDFNETDTQSWVKSEWKGLDIIEAKGDTVEFIAKYKKKGKVFEHHEVSKFKKQGDRWYFLEGDSHVHEEGKGHHHHHEPQAPVVREAPKVGRNDPCICGSGKKYKKCCAA